MHCDTLKQDNDSTVRGDGGSRVGEVRASTTSPMPEHKGFKPTVTVRDPPIPTYGPGSLSVKVMTIDAQWEGMGDVGSARYELALLPPCPTIRVLSYSN